MNRILFFSSFLILSACKKDHGEATDTEPPVIKMAAPTNNQSFAVGQTVSISGRITDDTKIGEVHLEITNKTSGAFITHEHFVPDSAGYSLARTFTIPSTAVYEIKVEADDTKGNTSQVQIAISAN